MTRLTVLFVIAVVTSLVGIGSRLVAEEPGDGPGKVLSVYSDHDDSLSPCEAFYEPFYFMPLEKADDIDVKRDYPTNKLSEKATGTCLRYIVEFSGRDEWAKAVFKPTGAQPGTVEGRDIAAELGVEPKQKVFLEWKARRQSDSKAVVGFRVGGLSVGEYEDGILPAAKSNPKFINLTADWVTYRIDLTSKIRGLQSVVSPFSVLVQSNDHPGQDSVIFYVDDIRFVAE